MTGQRWFATNNILLMPADLSLCSQGLFCHVYRKRFDIFTGNYKILTSFRIISTFGMRCKWRQTNKNRLEFAVVLREENDWLTLVILIASLTTQRLFFRLLFVINWLLKWPTASLFTTKPARKKKSRLYFFPLTPGNTMLTGAKCILGIPARVHLPRSSYILERLLVCYIFA